MNNQDTIELVRQLTSRMGIAVDDIAIVELNGQTLFNIQTKDSGALIGARGETLSALNHFVKKAVETKNPENDVRFVVDVNGYHLKHIHNLEAHAKTMAERARTFKYDVEMSPMSSYDRLIVHAALQSEPSVKTESAGEGATRHVVIKYVEAAA